MRRKHLVLAAAAVLIYTLGYGAVRWRKFVVMKEYHLKEQAMEVRRTGPGWDVRDDWKGRLKNKLNPAAFFCFRPLCCLEDHLRGFTRPLR